MGRLQSSVLDAEGAAHLDSFSTPITNNDPHGVLDLTQEHFLRLCVSSTVC